MSNFPLKALFGILLAINSASVLAHSFNLGLVIPMSGPDARAGQQMLDGFLLATTEEDSHADETSDGHLGGLDSHVLKVDRETDSSTLMKNLQALMQKRQPIFVTGLFTNGTVQLISKPIEQGSTVLFDPQQSSMWQNKPDSMKLMDGSSFSSKFQKRYGYPPTLNAMRGYIAARLIAATVRSLPEDDLYDKDILFNAFKQIETSLE